MTLIDLLLNPQLIAVLTPAGVILLAGCWLLYSNYKKILQSYMDLQEKRIKENQDMQKVYYDLAADVNKTLEILLATLGKKNGNGSNGGGQ